MKELLYEIEQQSPQVVKETDGETAWSKLKYKLQTILQLADKTCENIAADPQNHILRPPATAQEKQHPEDKKQHFYET